MSIGRDEQLLASLRLRDCLAIGTVFIAVIVFALPLNYETNDDAVMLLIASGGLAGTPDSHLVFINYAYGALLHGLYEWLPGTEWHTWLLLTIHAGSFPILLWQAACQQTDIAKSTRYLLAALFCIIEVQLLLNLQFTTTAALATTAGVSILFERRLAHAALGALALLIGSMLRFEAFALVLIVSAPLLTARAIRAAPTKLRLQRAGIAVVTLAGIATLSWIDNTAYERDEGWRDFREYNQLRGALNDNPSAGLIVDQLPTGVTIDDYWLLQRFLPNTKAMDVDKLRKIVIKMQDAPLLDKLHLVRTPHREYTVPLLLTLGVVIALLAGGRGSPDAPPLALAAALFLAALTFVSLDSVPKMRVLLSAMLPLLLHSAVSWSMASRRPPATAVAGAFVLLLVGWLCAVNVQIVSENRLARAEFERQHAFLTQYLSAPDKRVVTLGKSYSVEAQSPFRISATHVDGRILWGGWLSRYPLLPDPEESYRVFLEGGALFLFQSSLPVLPSVVRSIQASYGVELRPVVVAVNEPYMIVEFRPESP